MSNKSNNFGRAFEYIFINCLKESLLQYNTNVELDINSSYKASEKAYNLTDKYIQENLKTASITAIKKICEIEPILLENQ